MSIDPRLFCRVDLDTKKRIQMYALAHDTSVQEILQSYLNTLLELNIDPKEAIAAIRAAKKEPGKK